MSLVKFEILQKVAELKSFTKAADALGLTQSAVSHAITSLESEFGFRLIFRNRSAIELTREGETLLPSIRQVLYDHEKVRQEAAGILGLTRGTVRAGVFTSVSKHWLPQIIQIMEQKYPHIQIELREGNYADIEQGILNGKLDCGFINVYGSSPLHIVPLKKDRMLCVVSNSSSLYHQSVVSLKQIEQEPFIMPAFGGNHEVKRIFTENHIQPKIRFELLEETAILAMIRHHLGISILPEMVLPQTLSPLKAIPLETDSFRTLGLAIQIHPSPAAKKFVAITKHLLMNNES
ncbi:LysR family transcriptional regulator [Sporolactobacillus sp. THM7-4]|nr:LysR family transcriptional regulator [Sporolactobacillus sp. THM7-4]